MDIPESHICCGSAGTYNLLQPEIAMRLRDRKVANIERTSPDIIAAGNIGCITQIATGTRVPLVHTVELLDWTTGGPRPQALANDTIECALDLTPPITLPPEVAQRARSADPGVPLKECVRMSRVETGGLLVAPILHYFIEKEALARRG